MNRIANMISLSLWLPFVGLLVAYAQTRHAFYIWILGLVLVLIGIVESLKWITGSWLLRPAGATGCDAFCMGSLMEGQPGFPSGHMTISTAIVTSLWFYLNDNRVLYIGVPWILAMAWSRWVKRCHTWPQILAGIALGTYAGSSVSIGGSSMIVGARAS